MRRLRRTAGLLIVLTLLAAGCADRDDDGGDDAAPSEDDGGEDGGSSGDGETFGTLESPCGERDPDTAEASPADASETQGVAEGTINLGTIADPGFEGRPGLNQEIHDAAEAFAAWCNEQGGINGRQVELTLYDAAITQYQQRMGEACTNEFAMVGGGAVSDNQWETTGLECGLVDVAGFAVTPEKAGVSGPDQIEQSRTIQPVPNPSNEFPAGAGRYLAEEHPDAAANAAILFGDLATTIVQKDRTVEGLGDVGWDFTQETSYNILGEANWTPFAQEIADAEIGALSFVGDGEFMAQIDQALDEQGYDPEITLLDANLYDPEFVEAAGDAAEGDYIRLAFWPFEEASENEATQQYIDLVEENGGGISGLGAQSFSAFLLFASIAEDCDLVGDLTRSCILTGGSEVIEWTGGGLHAAGDPSMNSGPTCFILMEVADGGFQRAEPSEPDGGEDGYNCSEENVVELEGDFAASG